VAEGSRGGQIGFVFQEPTLMPWATVAANIQVPLTLLRVPRDQARARVREAIGLVGLDGFERGLSARAVGRDEDARVDRPRAGHPARLLLMTSPSPRSTRSPG